MRFFTKLVKKLKNDFFKDDSYRKNISNQKLLRVIDERINMFNENGLSEWSSILEEAKAGLITGNEDKRILLDNIDKVHTTEMGIGRIKKNLKLDTCDVVEYCKNKVLDKNCNIYKQGKNWYCEIDNIIITINSYSYTIITAHTKKKL